MHSSIPITALYGAINVAFNVGLAVRTMLLRRKHGVSLGHVNKKGESKEVLVASRTHANNIETIMPALFLLLVCEISGGSSAILHVLGGSLFVSRVLHAIGLPMRAPNFFRATGMSVTWLVLIAECVYAVLLR